jgi:hypothetical protein
LHVRGGAAEQTAFLVDGIPIFNPYHAAGTMSALNVDALERVQLSAAVPAPYFPDALSGVVSATTREPDPFLRLSGAASTTHGRVALDGPIGKSGASFLASLRTAFPGSAFTASEPTYLRGESGDALGKITAPAFGGELRALLYNNSNEFSALAQAGGADDPPDTPRHEFTWLSRSVGASWNRLLEGIAVRAQVWSNDTRAGMTWNSYTGTISTLRSERRDAGFLASADLASGARHTRSSYTFWARHTRDTYNIDSSSAAGEVSAFNHGSRNTLAAFTLAHERRVHGNLAASLGATALFGSDGTRISPSASLRWRPSPLLAISGGYSRSTQSLQSLRNPESLAGTLFPVDLFVATRSLGLPVASADQGLVAVDYRVATGIHAGAQLIARRLNGLLLVAPETGEPFSSGNHAAGSGRVVALTLELELSRARYGLLASYSFQRVHTQHKGGTYVPEHGSRHMAESGLIVFPSPTWSIRFGVSASAGRRGSAISGPLEWESCNLFDSGCEFGGAPYYDQGALGATSLPLYLRADIGVRKHWHVRLGGRDAEVAAFGSLTNLFGNNNVLAVARDPLTGDPARVRMRAFAPLVLGIDWRY